jgi:hypothetical protein
MTMAGWRSEDVASAGILHAAAAGDHGVAWACGILVQEAGRPFATLIFRRHRQGWEQVEAPQIGRVNRALAVSDADIWAVGDGCSLHWDGSRWQKVPTAVIKGSEPQFFGLAQFGADDVWTAGYAPMREHGQARGTVQRWDGSAWTDLPMPAVAAFWSLSGIAGASPEDLWAVGQVHGQRSDPLALHWDGHEWQRVPVPGVEGGSIQLSDIAVLGNGDAWAAGYKRDSGGIRTRQPFAVHWDGQAWTTGEVPEGPGQITQLASDGRKLWGLGYAAPRVAYVAALEGTSWQVIPGPPEPPEAHTALHGGTILSDGNLLAVGARSMPDDSSRPFAAVLTSRP